MSFNPIVFWLLWLFEGLYYLWVIFLSMLMGTLIDLKLWARKAWRTFAIKYLVLLLLCPVLSSAQPKVSACVLTAAPEATGANYKGIAFIPAVQLDDQIKWFTAQLTAGYDVSGNAPFVSLRMGAAFGHADKFMFVAYPFPYMNFTPGFSYTSPFGAEIRWKNMLHIGVEYVIQKEQFYPTARFSHPLFTLKNKAADPTTAYITH
jgi:hypothetical protein